MTSAASTLITSLVILRLLAIAMLSLKAYNLARRQFEAPISLEKPLIQDPFESLISPPPPAQFEDIRIDAFMFSLYHPRSGLVQEMKC